MKKNIVVLLEDIRSALNVGAIIRTCECAGIKEIFLCGITPESNHPKVSKTALGAQNFIKTRKIYDLFGLIQKLKKNGYTILGIEQTNNSKNFTETKVENKIALIFGNEISGISKKTLELCDLVLEIPMQGKKNSLNVATTVGIITFYFSLIKK